MSCFIISRKGGKQLQSYSGNTCMSVLTPLCFLCLLQFCEKFCPWLGHWTPALSIRKKAICLDGWEFRTCLVSKPPILSYPSHFHTLKMTWGVRIRLPGNCVMLHQTHCSCCFPGDFHLEHIILLHKIFKWLPFVLCIESNPLLWPTKLQTPILFP